MDQVSVFLLTVAGIFLVGVLGELIFERFQIPDAVWLVAVGVALGPGTGLLKQDWLRQIAPFFAALTLIVILFDGGRRLRVDSLGRAALPAVGIGLATFALSALATALLAHGAAAVGWIPGPWSLHHSLLLGAILGGSSSVVIMPSMARARVNPRTADLLSLESAVTDILCVVGAGALTQLLLRGAGASEPLAVAARTFGIGFGIGVAAGAMGILAIGLLRKSGHAFPLTLSGLLILYVVVDRAGGSAALAVLTFAVLTGNASWILNKTRLRREPLEDPPPSDFHDQLVFIVKSFFFTFIGAMLGPPWGLAVLGLLMGLVLLPVRMPVAWLAGAGLRLPADERGILAVALPRGLAAGVLATLPAAAGVPGTEALPVVVFPAVIATILIFAFGFRRVRGANMPPAIEVPAREAARVPADAPGERSSGPPGGGEDVR